MLIDDEVLRLSRNVLTGPLHNPANILGIEACQELMPDVPQVAVFDTAFHGTVPNMHIFNAIPYEYYEKIPGQKIRFSRNFPSICVRASS